MAYDPNLDAKEAFASLYRFAYQDSGHIQVEPVSPCHLVNKPPASQPPKPQGLTRKSRHYTMPGERDIHALTSGCPVGVDGFPVDDPQAYRADPAYQPAQPEPSSSPRQAKSVRLKIPVIMGGRLV